MRTPRRLRETYRFPSFRPAPTGHLRRPESPRYPAPAAGKMTACGACGLIQRAGYDRKIRRVRDRPCGARRIFLKLEIRRRWLALRHGEAGEVGLVGGHPFLHHARLILRGTSLPDHDGQGRSPGDAPSLVDHHGFGNGIPARAATPRESAGAERGRDRRDIHPQGAHLPDCRQRSGVAAADLVRGQRPLGRAYGRVLPGARLVEEQKDSVGGHGHVEGVSQRHAQAGARAAGRYSVRQIPRHPASWRGVGRGSPDGIRPSDRQGAARHHRPEIHAAVAPGASEAGWLAEPETAAQGEHTFEHGRTSSRRNSGSSGTTSGKAGRVVSSRTGERH